MPDSAEPTPEVVSMLARNGYTSEQIAAMGWFATPNLYPVASRKSRKDLQENGEVDAMAVVTPFLGNPILNGSLRTMDFLNGCGKHCDTCLADAPLPSRIFGVASLARLWRNQDFLDMLQPDSFRVGSSGDISDHPYAIPLVKLILEATDYMHRKRTVEKKQPYKIKIYTNYRMKNEQFLDELLEIARASRRLYVTVSLPLNRATTVSQQFELYVRNRSSIFSSLTGRRDERGIMLWNHQTNNSNIFVQDVNSFGRTMRPIFFNGRILSEKLIKQLGMHEDPNYALKGYYHRSAVKPYLNPDGLWMMIYATLIQSHTCRVFTPLTPENVPALSRLGFHPDFPTPPNWPGHEANTNFLGHEYGPMVKADKGKPLRKIKRIGE